jgi:hypothetical protein
MAVLMADWYKQEVDYLRDDPIILEMAESVRFHGQEDEVETPNFVMAAFHAHKERGGTPHSIGGPQRAIQSLLAGLPPLDRQLTEAEWEIVWSDEQTLESHERCLAVWQKFLDRGIETGPSGEQYALLASEDREYIADRRARGVPDCGLPRILSRVGGCRC